LIGVGLKTPLPDGALSNGGAAVEDAAPEIVVVPDDSVVVVAEDGADVDVLAPEPLVVETASCASVCSAATVKKIPANEAVRSRVIIGSRGSSLDWSKNQANGLSHALHCGCADCSEGGTTPAFCQRLR
jgi:hypothetical protein